MVETCVIVGAGEFNGFATEYDREHTLFIAADGGINYLADLGLQPDIWIGDGDSLRIAGTQENASTRTCDLQQLIADIHTEVIKLPTHKDETDTLAAVRKGISLGYTQFHIYGGMGGRIDHTMANIKTLAYISSQNMTAYMFGCSDYMTVLENGEIGFSDKEQGYISVFSMSDVSNGITISGLEYEINNASLTSTDSIGVSNAFIGKKSSISVLDGRLLIMLEQQPREFPQRA